MGFPCGEGKKNSSLCPGQARGEAELPPHETKERHIYIENPIPTTIPLPSPLPPKGMLWVHFQGRMR